MFEVAGINILLIVAALCFLLFSSGRIARLHVRQPGPDLDLPESKREPWSIVERVSAVLGILSFVLYAVEKVWVVIK